MANPNFPSDGQAERVDALVDSGNAVSYKLGIAKFVPTGGTTPTGWAGSASHSQGLPIGTNDGVMVVAGDNPSGNAQAFGVDAGGGLQLSNYCQAPQGLTLTATSGSLSAATYYWRVSATTAAGETVPCTEVSKALGASSGCILTWTPVPGATGYRVYGRTTGAELFIAAVTGGQTATYTDNGSITPSGAMPTTNTAVISIGSVSGTVTAVGAAASGSALSGNPVLVAGSDATNARTLLVDTSGRQIVVGTSAIGAAVAGNPVMAGTSDGTNARYLLSDTSGRPNVVGAAAAGAAIAGNPVLIGGSDGTNARNIATDTNGALTVTANRSAHATYVASIQGVATTSAAELITIEAPAGSAVRLKRLVIVNPGSGTTGLYNFTLLRTTTAGTGGAITPASLDTADSAYGGIVRSLPSPAGTESTVLYNIPVNVPTAVGAFTPIVIDWDGPREMKAPTIAAGTANGIALKCPAITSGANFSAFIEFVV